MVIHPYAKYGKPMSNQKKVMDRTKVMTFHSNSHLVHVHSEALKAFSIITFGGKGTC